jgi:hypothetical protein
MRCTWDRNARYAERQGSDQGNAGFVSKRSQSEYEDLGLIQTYLTSLCYTYLHKANAELFLCLTK